jgi:hypothetical protein
MSDVSCATIRICEAVGLTPSGAALVVRTVDDGTRWERQRPPRGVGSLSGVACPTVRKCVAIGAGPGRDRDHKRGEDVDSAAPARSHRFAFQGGLPDEDQVRSRGIDSDRNHRRGREVAPASAAPRRHYCRYFLSVRDDVCGGGQGRHGRHDGRWRPLDLPESAGRVRRRRGLRRHRLRVGDELRGRKRRRRTRRGHRDDRRRRPLVRPE